MRAMFLGMVGNTQKGTLGKVSLALWKSDFNTEREREGEKLAEVIVIMSMILMVLSPWEMHGTVRLLS